MPGGDVELLRFRSLSDINGEHSLRRVQSEASFPECGVFAMLKLSKTRITVGDSVTVYWDIHENCSADDWIGLFDLDYPTSLSNYLDSKQRGVTGARRGAIKWVISRNVVLNNVENRCIFKYIYANTGSVKAISPTLSVHNPYAEIHGSGGRHQANISQDSLCEISVSGLSASGLKKNIFGKPSPYVKLSVIPSRRHFRSWKHHHGQIAKTSSQSHTIDPNWQNEEFVFVGSNDDVLEVEVRNKFSGTRPAFSRFLGKLSVPLNDVFHQGNDVSESVINKTLCKRTPSDRIQGRICFIVAPLNTANRSSRDEEVRERNRPSDIDVLGSHGGVMTNPALRSSAPDLLRPTLDISPSTTADSQPGSPLSPFSAETHEGSPVNRRRNLPREMRPFSEFYTEEFVPLDPDISTLRRNATSEEGSGQTANDEAPSRESVEEQYANEGEPMATVENGEVVQDHTTQDTEEEPACIISEQEERSSDEAIENVETIDIAVPPVNDEHLAGSQESLDILEYDENDENNDTHEASQQPSDQLNTVSSVRESVGNIELTEDSPLRILEESEQALEEEATFSPSNVDDSDGTDDIEEGAYGFLFGNANDGDDEMDSERSSPDDDVRSSGVISVDSWTYEHNESSETQETGPSAVSPPRYTKVNSSKDDGICRNEDIPIHTTGERDEIESRRSEGVICLPPEDSARIRVNNDPEDKLEAGVAHEDISTITRDSLPVVESMITSRIVTTSQPLSDTGEHVKQTKVVAEDIANLDSPRNLNQTDKSSSRPIVTLVGRSDNQRLDLSSVAIPMEDGEPECMDFTSVQNSSAPQMVVAMRSNRSESLVETRRDYNKPSPNVRYNRSQSLIEASSNRNQSIIVDTRTSGDESMSDARINQNESRPVERTNRYDSSADASIIRDEPIVGARTYHNESNLNRRTNRSRSIDDTCANRNESIVVSRTSRSESFDGLRSNSNGLLVDSRSNRCETDSRSQQLVGSRAPNGVRSDRGVPAEDTRLTRRQQTIVSFSRSDDLRSSTRSEGHVSFIESVPVRPSRRPKHIARTMSDTRGIKLSHRPDRPERPRRIRTETEPRASVRHQASEPYHRTSISDPVVMAVPVSAELPTSRTQTGNSAEAIFVSSAIPSAATSVTPISSPSLDSGNSSPRSRNFEDVVAQPLGKLEDNRPTETRAVLAAVLSPRETTTVTPVPSPTAEQAGVDWNEQETDGVASLPLASGQTCTTNNDFAQAGAIPKPSPADLNRENISIMLRTYVRSAQPPQRPAQTDDPRYRREEESSMPHSHGRSRPPRHEAVEVSNGNGLLPAQERGRPPSHEAAVVSRRRSSRQHRQRSHERTDGNQVHLHIQDSEHRTRRSNEDDPLPPNWEKGVDSHGRVYYIDHANRTTTWSRPTRELPQNETNMNDINTHWQSLDRRYESFRRTLRGRNRQSRPPLPEAANQSHESTQNHTDSGTRSRSGGSTALRSESLPPGPPTLASTPSTSGTPTTSRAHAQAASRSRSSSTRSAALLDSPAVKFITRPDFVDFIKNSGVAGQYYFQSQMLKLIISKIRADPANFEKYRHQVELVRFLNQFADAQSELPPSWDKKVDQNGRLYFIDHNARTTTFIDPRLPYMGTIRRHRAGTETEPRRSRAPPPRPPPPRGHSRTDSDASSSTTLSYNQQVVGFLSQPNIDDIIARKHPGFARNMALKANIRRVKVEGERSLERLSNNVDFVMLLSLFEDQIMSFVPPDVSKKADPTSPSSSLPSSPVRTPLPLNRKSAVDCAGKGCGGASGSSGPSPAPYRRDFEAKVRSFHRQLYHKGYGQGPNKIKMTIRRDRLLEDAYDQIMKETARSLQRNRLEITFAGEEGLDYGGPAREFFFLISRQIFNPYYGLFEYSANDTYTVQVSPVSLYVDNSHEWFRFCGRIVGLVIIHQHLLDAFFTRTYYKALLRSPCDLSDVESLDALFHQSMTWVIENDIEDVLDLTFSVSEEIFGQVTERELIPGGKDIAVTEENKSEYVNEMVKWRVERGVSEQMESIVRGFIEVIDPNLIRIFDARELELVISGTADIDIKDWRRHTEYRSGFHDGHKVVKWFWKAVSSFDNEQRLRLLQFVTGTSSIPYEGFAALRGSTGPRKFSIERWGDFSKLPRAHTCFNRLDLPVYRSYEELLEKLTFAVEETGTFSIQ